MSARLGTTVRWRTVRDGRDGCCVRAYGSGPPVLLIHGVAGSGLIWSEVAARVGERCEVFAVDLLGYGHSARPVGACTPDRHVAAIRAAVADTIGARPHAVVGLSMGALLALDYAAAHPDEVQHVVSLGLPAYRDEADARSGLATNGWTRLTLRHPRRARFALGALWGMGRRSTALSAIVSPRIYSAAIARETMMVRHRTFASTLTHCLVANPAERLVRAAWATPLTFVHGADDAWTSPERIADLVALHPTAHLVVLDGVGHNVAVLDPERAARHLLRQDVSTR